ncbi:MAG: hypothetical protein Unbinned6805contig1000_36 [Prokaryotic dsDNA virus sp.]|nr:MAG: hypothetical protein Unbinned6805contig1000_36 [Prokaryotic dsDNA virus sp.]
MSIRIIKTDLGWIATCGSIQAHLTDKQLHPFLIKYKAKGYSITFRGEPNAPTK